MKKHVVRIWGDEFRNRHFLAEAILTLLIVVAVIRLCGYVMNYLDVRKGAFLADPILQLFHPIRVTWIAFGILWSSLILAVIFLAHEPRRLVMAFQAAALILTFRTITLFLVPLEPIASIIPMPDPIAMSLSTGKLIIKDLFFSGHTSAVFLAYLTASRSWLKPVFLLGTIAIAACMILQHVHYSVDVFVAPFFTYTSWKIICGIHEKFAGERATSAP